MRFSDVIDVNAIARSHVGGILSVNYDWGKLRKIWKFLYRDYL